MSWIESHQSLSTHRKTIKAARLLRCDKHKLIGHLHELWWWGLDNAADTGELAGIERSDLAWAAQWKGDAEAFAVVLIECGFVDSDDSGERLGLHDWWQYAGKLNAKRAKDRERKSDGTPREFQRNSNGSRAEVAGTHQPTNLPDHNTTSTARGAEVIPEGTPIPEYPLEHFRADLLTEEMVAWTEETLGLIPAEIKTATDEFMHYWQQRPGTVRTLQVWRDTWGRRMKDDATRKATRSLARVS